jgi:hypothetical protein
MRPAAPWHCCSDIASFELAHPSYLCSVLFERVLANLSYMIRPVPIAPNSFLMAVIVPAVLLFPSQTAAAPKESIISFSLIFINWQHVQMK